MTQRARIILLACVAGMLAAGGVASLALRGDAPAALADLERLQAAGDEARITSAEIAANLERIASNLERGAALPEASAEIRELTLRQRASLDELAGLLRDQLETLNRTAAALDDTRSSTDHLAGLSARQVDILSATVAALDRLERLAASASATSADVARAARYGARLAESSARYFGGDP